MNWPSIKRVLTMPMPSCGSSKQFLVKTAIMGGVIPVFLLLYHRVNPFTAADYTWLVLISVGPLMILLVFFNHFVIKEFIEKVTFCKIQLVWHSVVWRIWSISFVLTAILLFLTRFEFISIDLYRSFLLTGFILLISIMSTLRFNSLQNRLLARYKNGLAALSEKLAAQDQNNGEETVTICSENVNEILQLSLRDLLFIRSDQNYVTVFFRQNGKIQNQLFRNSLSRIEKDLKKSPVIRCHRSYLVNLKQAVKVSGNAQGMSISLRGQEDKLPVSRKYMHSVRHAILNLN